MNQDVVQIEAYIYQQSFYRFVLAAFKDLYPYEEFIDNWHIKYICDELQVEIERVAAGKPKTKDLNINIPPRSLKSFIASVCLNAWAWTRYPWLKFITVSYSATLSIKLSRLTRQLIDSHWYQDRFGRMYERDRDQWSKSNFRTLNGGFRFSTSEGGTVCGDGADIIVVDDMINPVDANSDASRLAAEEFYIGTLHNRLNRDNIGLRLIIQQRLHFRDTTAIACEYGDYRTIVIPAQLNDDVEPFALREYYKDGLFFPQIFSKEMLDRAAKRRLFFASQYLQNPIPEGGNIFKEHWFKESPSPKRSEIDKVIISMDTAFEESQESDYSVLCVLFQMGERYHLKSVVREQMPYYRLKKMAVDLAKFYKPDCLVIEKKASGHSLIQDLKNDHKYVIEAVTPTRDKVSRAYTAQPSCEAGLITVEENAAWLPDFITELTRFPKGSHDDQVDSFCMGVNHLDGVTGANDIPEVWA